jgi:hypothetical protein
MVNVLAWARIEIYGPGGKRKMMATGGGDSNRGPSRGWERGDPNWRGVGQITESVNKGCAAARLVEIGANHPE